jgi:hypothetical protein
MLTRGSLTHCRDALALLFADKGHRMLSIVHNPSGKYYSVLSEDDLRRYNERQVSDYTRLVCRLTRHEYMLFRRPPQTDLFTEQPDA